MAVDMRQEFEALIKQAIAEGGVTLKEVPAKLAVYMAERATHLSTLVGQAGFDQAVIAERNNVAMRAGIETHDAAKRFDAQFLGLIQGALRIMALVLIPVRLPTQFGGA